MLILDAFEFNKGNVPRDFTKKILMTITYIEENIMYRRITSIENTNNVLTAFDESDKIYIKNECKKILIDYNYQPNSILKYFS